MPGRRDPVASRAASLEASRTMQIATRAAQMRRQGIDVASLSVGEPDFDTPEHVKEACRQALAENFTHYTPSPGIPEVRQAVADHVRAADAIPCDAAHVMATPTKHGLFAAALAFIEAGDEVLLTDPSFVSYAPIVRFAGGRPVWVPLAAEEGYGIQAEAVAERLTPKTKMVWLCSPSNPTGGVDDPAQVRAVAELAEDHDLLILSDEIYARLQFEGERLSPGAVAFDRTLTVGGLSKSHAMTGWRAGWVVADSPLLDPVMRIQSQSITHVASFVQKAMVAALQGPQDAVGTMARELEARRDLVMARLETIPGVTAARPRGAFYAWLAYDLDMASDAVAEHLLERHHVAVVPGTAFGPSGARRLRLSFGTGGDALNQGLERLAEGLKALARSVPARGA